MMQHEQSSPHQQGSLIGGARMGPLDAGEEDVEDAAELVAGSMAADVRALRG